MSFQKLWSAKEFLLSKFRSTLYYVTHKLFFNRIGAGLKVYGFIDFGTVSNNLNVGSDVVFGRNGFIACAPDAAIDIGDNCSFNTGFHILSLSSIEIGHGCRFGEYVSIRDQNHNFSQKNKLIFEQGYFSNPIKIGNNCWIGRGVFIGPGVVIGDNCVIGANSVVINSLPKNTVCAGAPALVKKEI